VSIVLLWLAQKEIRVIKATKVKLVRSVRRDPKVTQVIWVHRELGAKRERLESRALPVR
jgi:hypothetical protein